MARIVLLLSALLCLACQPEQPSGPDWGDKGEKPGVTTTPDEPNEPDEPKPDTPEEPKPEIVEQTIVPTTAVAPLDADIAGLRYEPGISINLTTKNFANRLAEIANAGFKYIEITLKQSHGLMDMSDEQVTALFSEKQSQATAAGLTVWSIHLPFEDKDWTNVAGKESIRRQSVDNIMRVLRLCVASFPECKNYVLHASKGVLSPRSESVNQARKSLQEMLPEAKKLGVRICVENLVGSLCPTIAEMNDTIAGFEDAWVTYDIGHANCVAEDVLKFIEWIGPRLGTVHIHDTVYGSRVDDHRLVGKGDIDKHFGWDNVYHTMLQDTGYRGVFLFELSGLNAVDVMQTYKMIVDKYKATYEK